jgi:hypothetical protein
MAHTHQPLSEAVIQVAYSRPESFVVPRSLTLTWASRVESLREAPPRVFRRVWG